MRLARRSSSRRAVVGALVLTSLAACGRRGDEMPPDSPVGRYEVKSFRVAGFEKAADGRAQPRMEPVRRTSIDVRADHTLRYEWTNLAEPGKGDGSLDATWREPTKEERAGITSSMAKWFVFEKGEPDRRRDWMETRMHILWTPGGTWWFPVVDDATGRLGDAYWPVGSRGAAAGAR